MFRCINRIEQEGIPNVGPLYVHIYPNLLDNRLLPREGYSRNDIHFHSTVLLVVHCHHDHSWIRRYDTFNHR